MKGNTKIALAIVCLGLGALACQAVSVPGSNSGTDTPVVPPNTNARVLLSDDFSSVEWGTGTDTDSSVEYVDEALKMVIFTKNWFVWSPSPGDQDYDNVHMEVTVLNNSTDSTTAFGLICNQQLIDTSFYYFAITPAGEYAIAKAITGVSDVFLTNNDEMAQSDLIAQDAPSYRVGADCGNGTLTLYVDGQQIASVTDTTHTGGGVALFTWSGDNPNSADVSFDDFLMTELP